MNKFTKYKLAGSLDTTISGKLLYLMLLDIVDHEGKIVMPQKRISESLGISRSTVSKNMHRLEDAGAILIEPTYNECNGRMPNRYKILEG